MSVGLFDMWRSSPVLMSVLFFCSLLLMATALERIWCYLGSTRVDKDLCRDMLAFITSGNMNGVVQQASRSTTYIARAVLEVALLVQAGKAPSRPDFEDLWFMRKEEAAEYMRAKLVVFSTLSFVTPLIGLMGSVLGIHHSFHSIALTGMGGPSVVAAGVSEALLCTLAGVAIAIPAMVLMNVFSSMLSRRMSSWDRMGQQMLKALQTLAAGEEKEKKGSR